MIACVLIVCIAGLMAQVLHYRHVDTHREWQDNAALAATLQSKLDELDKLKSEVSKLSLRIGIRG